MINKEYKDRLFKAIFGSEEHRNWTLELYNAVNGSGYDDPSKIEFNTIENAVYMGMKDDVSFILYGIVSLYEQQSTFNPNMPVRLLMYLGKVYDRYITVGKYNPYGSKLIELPVPKLVVFYNGLKDEPDEVTLELVDAFPEELRNASDVQVQVRMLNINSGKNEKLLSSCRPLMEYSWLISRIRTNRRTMEIEDAVDLALDEMPEDFVIRDFLIGNRAEVRDMCITEYNEEETMQMFKEEGKEEGIKEGIKIGEARGEARGKERGQEELNSLYAWLQDSGRQDDLMEAIRDRECREKLLAEYRAGILKNETVN